MAHKWDQCRMMNRKRGPEHIPLESLTLRGEHVIVRMRVVYRGKKLVHYKGCFITVKLFEKKKKKKRERKSETGFWWKKEFRTCRCFHCSLSARSPFPCSSPSCPIRQLKPHPYRIKGCGLGPHHPLPPDFGQETNSLIRFQCDPEEQWKARAVPSLPPTWDGPSLTLCAAACRWGSLLSSTPAG